MPKVTGPLTQTALTDTYPTHDSLLGLGGLREVTNHTTRNAIPNLQRREGMIVYTANDQLYWRLNASPWSGVDADWSAFTTGGTGTDPTAVHLAGAESITGVKTFSASGQNWTDSSGGIWSVQINTDGSVQTTLLSPGSGSGLSGTATGTLGMTYP